MHRGCLFPPGFSKGGISPGDFHALIFWRQLVGELQRQNAALEARVAELQAALDGDLGVVGTTGGRRVAPDAARLGHRTARP